MSYPNEAYAQTAPGNQDYLGNQKGQYIGGAEQAVPRATTTSVIGDTMAQTDKMVSRILQLEARLCGSHPMPSTGKDAAKSPDGMLHVIQEQSYILQARISYAHEALDRIEALL